jgi:predicted AAA+ superfamily ATPase
VVIDEVQKAPGLFQAIKLSVDANRRPGRFLLTGSANVLLLRRISESLAGRMEIFTLEPLSQGELRGRRESFIDVLFGGNPATLRNEPQPSLTEVVVTGGYPEALARKSPKRRAAWFEAYVTALLQRDVRDLANIEGLTEMPRLLSLLAGRVGGLLNISELARGAGIAHTTLKRYLTLLQATFLLRPCTAASRWLRLGATGWRCL